MSVCVQYIRVCVSFCELVYSTVMGVYVCVCVCVCVCKIPGGVEVETPNRVQLQDSNCVSVYKCAVQ